MTMADPGLAREIPIPPGVPVSRHTPRPTVRVSDDQSQLPLISSKDPQTHIREHWRACVRIFHLSQDADLKAYEQIWQRVTDGLALVSESRVDFYQGEYKAFLRWVEFSYSLPPADT